MATYRALDDGSYEVDTPAGPLRTALSPEQLQWAGYAPPPIDPMAGAVADASPAPGMPSGLNLRVAQEQQAADVPAPSPAAEGAGGAPGGGAFNVNPNSGAGTQSSTENALPDTPMSATNTDGTPKEPRLPEGTKEIELNVGARAPGDPDADRPRYASTKARDQRTSFQIQKGNEKLLGETDDELTNQAARKKARLQMQADTDEERGRKSSEMYQRDIVQPLEREEIEQRKRVQWINTETTKRLDELKRSREAIDKLEVNPDQIYEGKEWARALAFLSIIAGGALQGKNGGGVNPGLQGMNDVINRSIEVQKENYRRKQEGHAAKETEFERLMKVYGDPRLAEEELRNRHEALAAAYAKKFAMDVGTEDVKANLAEAMADVDRGVVDDRLKLNQQLSDKVVENYSYIPAQTYQVGGRRPESAEARARRVNIDGTSGYVLRPGDAPKIQEANDQLSHLDQQFSDYEQLMDNPEVGPNERKAAADALSLRLGPAMAVLQGQGAMSKDEQEAAPRGLGDAAEWVNLTNDQVKARIRQTRRFFNDKRKVVLQNNVYADEGGTVPLLKRAPRSQRE